MGTSACGVFDCNTCEHMSRGRCPGCANGNALLMAEGKDLCAIYECVTSKNLVSCDTCTSVVCQFPKNLEVVCPVRARFEKKRCYTRKLAEHYFARLTEGGDDGSETKISDRTITRLRWYLFALDDFLARGVGRVSSQDIARKVGVKPGLIRRDLSHFGEFGRPSIGYDAAFLRRRLAEILHLDNSKSVLWVGSGRLKYDASIIDRFGEHNCNIAAVFDSDPSQVGTTIGGLKVLALSSLPSKVRELEADAAVIAVAREEAQAVAEALVMAGVRAILNLTPVVLVTPPGVVVRNVNIVAELFALSYYCGERQEHAVA